MAALRETISANIRSTKIRMFIICALIITSTPNIGVAQVSITTLGSNDAALCSQNAFDGSTDLSPCNSALQSGNLTRLNKIKTHVNRGVIYNARLNPLSAIEDFDAALELDPDRGEAYANRGSSYFLLKDYSQALSDYQKALDLNARKKWAIWYNIGLTYQTINNDEQARQAFKKSLSIKPDFTPAIDKLAN